MFKSQTKILGEFSRNVENSPVNIRSRGLLDNRKSSYLFYVSQRMADVIYFLGISTDALIGRCEARTSFCLASANHAACTMQCINTSHEGRAIHHAYRYAGFGDVYILSVHPLHQRVTFRIIRDLHLLLPAASASTASRYRT